MFDPIQKIIDRINKIDIEAIATDIVENDMQSKYISGVQSQLQKGERGDGSKLPNYSETSVKLFGKPRGRMTLKDTGAYYEGMEIFTVKNQIIVESSDSKADDLSERYDQNETLLQIGKKTIEQHKDESQKRLVNEIFEQLR